MSPTADTSEAESHIHGQQELCSVSHSVARIFTLQNRLPSSVGVQQSGTLLMCKVHPLPALQGISWCMMQCASPMCRFNEQLMLVCHHRKHSLA